MRRRFAAFMFDGLILAFCASVVLGAYASVFGPEADQGGAIALVVVMAIAASVLPVVHEGGSFGQVAFGLQVVDLDGRRLSAPHALVRMVAFHFFAATGAYLGGVVGALTAALAGATETDGWAGAVAGAMCGLLALAPLTIISNSLGLAAHDVASRSIVIMRGDGHPFASRLVPGSARRAHGAWAGLASFTLLASVFAYLSLPTGSYRSDYVPPITTGVARPDRTAGPLGVSDVVVSGTIYVPKGQQFSVTPMQPTTSAVSGRPRGLASLGAGWCSDKSCDVLANARVRFVAPSRYGWQPLADTGSTATTDAQGSYRMILPQRYAVAPTPTYVMATDPGERLAVIAEVAMDQQRPGVGITLDLDHSTTYLALLRCPGGGTLGTCVSSAGDPSAEQLEKALAARFKEMGNAGDLRTPERTIGALVVAPAVVAALEVAVAAGHAPTAATAAIVAATRASPPLVAVTGPASPQPTAAPPRSAPAVVQSPPRTAAPPAATVQPRPPVTAPTTPRSTTPPPTQAARPPTVEPGCPSVYDGTYIGQAIYQVMRIVVVNGVVTEKPDPPRALNLTVVLKCRFVNDVDRLVVLDVRAAGADHPWFGALGVVAASGDVALPLDLPELRAWKPPMIQVIRFANGRQILLSEAVVPSSDASRIASELGAAQTWATFTSETPVTSWFPDGVPPRGGLPGYEVNYLSWSLTKTSR